MAFFGSEGQLTEHVSRSAGEVPSACPVCHSLSIVTTVKVPDVNTYWRCVKCGEVFNVARRQRWGRDR